MSGGESFNEPPRRRGASCACGGVSRKRYIIYEVRSVRKFIECVVYCYALDHTANKRDC
jgi:hypothetical protein